MTDSAVHLGLENSYKIVNITQFLMSEQYRIFFRNNLCRQKWYSNNTVRLAAFQIVQYVNTTHTKNIFAQGKCDLLTIKGKKTESAFYLSLTQGFHQRHSNSVYSNNMMSFEKLFQRWVYNFLTQDKIYTKSLTSCFPRLNNWSRAAFSRETP